MGQTEVECFLKANRRARFVEEHGVDDLIFEPKFPELFSQLLANPRDGALLHQVESQGAWPTRMPCTARDNSPACPQS